MRVYKADAEASMSAKVGEEETEETTTPGKNEAHKKGFTRFQEGWLWIPGGWSKSSFRSTSQIVSSSPHPGLLVQSFVRWLFGDWLDIGRWQQHHQQSLNPNSPKQQQPLAEEREPPRVVQKARARNQPSESDPSPPSS